MKVKKCCELYKPPFPDAAIKCVVSLIGLLTICFTYLKSANF